MTRRTTRGWFWPTPNAGDERIVGAHLADQLAQLRAELQAVDVDDQAVGRGGEEVACRQRRIGLDRDARVVGRRPDAHGDDRRAPGDVARAEREDERSHSRQRRAPGGHGRSSRPAALSASKRASRASPPSRGRDPDAQVALGQETRRLLGPFDELQPRVGEDLAKARVFPFLGIVEAIEVAVGDLEAAVRRVGAIRLHQRVGRALDRAFDAQAVQQMARKGRLARAQRPMQLDEGIAQRTMAGDPARRFGAGELIGPCGVARF